MEIITSHTNADFDALASMVAAKKLYPEAVLVFPGSQEKSMRDFFLESAFYAVEAERLRNIEVDDITRLIIVDNRNPARLGKLADALRRPGVSVHIYDHHPAAETDVKGEVEIVEEVGATTTFMVELLGKRGIPITPLEATIFALGIYEETGSLTYVSTTDRDARAVADLISRGAQLTVVSDFLSRELSADQAAVLKELTAAAARYDINGVQIVISALPVTTYIPDLANIAHKMRDKENLDVLFLVVQMGDKTQIIARSRLAAVNAGHVLEAFGGGGHATAASAVVKDSTYLQAKERMIDILKHQVRTGRSVKDIMTTPVKTIPAGSTIAEAGEAMTRFSVNVLPVIQEERYQGLITREVVQKALFHGLGKQKAEAFMTTGGPVASPEMPVDQVEHVMIEEHQRFLPVLDSSGALAGAVTRTDLLRSLHEERLSAVRDADGSAPRAVRNIRNMIEERLPADVIRTLRTVGEVGDESGFPVYLVGGIVRDLFLNIPNLDIDIVVEGDAITFAGMLLKRTGGRMRSHLKFGTAVVVLPDGLKLDIATARLEYYDSPAALPTVELSSIKKDLYRRDFTINTLAVRLNSREHGSLIDFFNGLRDIKDKTIRVLHSLSFVEDPTRILRAVRFEQRFDFRISKHTQNLIKHSVDIRVFDHLSGERFFNEMVLLFSEADPEKVVRRLREFDVLKFIHPALKGSAETERLFARINEVFTWFRLLYIDEVKPDSWFVYFLGLLDRVKDTVVEEVLQRLSAPARVRKQVLGARERYRDVLYVFYKEHRLKPSAVYDLLAPLEIESLLLMMAKAKQDGARKYISLYLTRLREVKVALNGDDLKKLGIQPGPRYKKLLAELLNARLDGVVRNREEEIEYVRKKA